MSPPARQRGGRAAGECRREGRGAGRASAADAQRRAKGSGERRPTHSPREAHSGRRLSLRIPAALALAAATTGALSGPVEVYRTGKYCPQDRPSGSPAISEAQAVERAKTLLPEGFCGPSTYVSGCDYLTEYTFQSWRVYAHQYKDRGGRHDWAGRTHTYVILDPVGNCLANIPGTVLGGTS